MPITADLQASRISGPAPLAVRLDASATSNALGLDSWREIGYCFDYGDQHSSPSWIVSNPTNTVSWNTGTKNEDRGAPIGAHVYETPGTYTCRVRALAAGNRSDAEVIITVTDPNTVYAGTDTICISQTSDTTGAPSGATLITNATSWPTWQSNKRYLLRSGQNFDARGQISLAGITDTQISRFGNGADPVVRRIISWGGCRRNSYFDLADTDATTFDQTSSRNSTEDILLLRYVTNKNLSIGGAVIFDWNSATEGNKPGIHFPIRDFVVDCKMSDNDSTLSASKTGIWLGGRDTVVMNCYFDNTVEHNIRSYSFYGLLIQHNRFRRVTNTIRVHIKLNAEGDEDPYSEYPSVTDDPISQYGIIRGNVIGDANDVDHAWSIEVNPQNNNGPPVQPEGVSDVIVEANTWVEKDYQRELNFSGRRIAARGNIHLAGTIQTGTDIRPDRTPAGFLGPYYVSDDMIDTESPSQAIFTKQAFGSGINLGA